jgi:hypothetical protein
MIPSVCLSACNRGYSLVCLLKQADNNGRWHAPSRRLTGSRGLGIAAGLIADSEPGRPLVRNPGRAAGAKRAANESQALMNWIDAAMSDYYGNGLIIGPAGVVFAAMCFFAPSLMARAWGFGYTLSPRIVRVLGWLCVAVAIYEFACLAGYGLLGWRSPPPTTP